jgi:hypothetical protein
MPCRRLQETRPGRELSYEGKEDDVEASLVAMMAALAPVLLTLTKLLLAWRKRKAARIEIHLEGDRVVSLARDADVEAVRRALETTRERRPVP